MDHIKGLNACIDFCKREKHRLIEFVKNLEARFYAKEIGRDEANRALESKLKGKNVKEHIAYYNNKIKGYQIELRRIKSKHYGLLFGIILVLAISLFLFYPFLTGFVLEAGNETIFNETNVTAMNETKSNESNITENTSEIKESKFTIIEEGPVQRIVIGEPVIWKKRIVKDKGMEIIDIPDVAKDVIVKKQTIAITGEVIFEEEKKGVLFEIYDFFRMIFSRLTGNVVADENDVVLDESGIYEIEYTLPGPSIFEEELEDKKKVTVIEPSELDVKYTDILTFTSVKEIVSDRNLIQVYWVEEDKQMDFDAYDTDSNGYMDRVEWITPHLSNQTFEISILRTQLCAKQNQQVNQNSFPSSCNGTYPNSCVGGDMLGCDDSNLETAVNSKSGPTRTYAGVRIASYNSSVLDCVNVSEVFLCYKFWTSGNPTQHICNIGVDSNSGASWSNISVSCSGSEPFSISCVNVTSNEPWMCNNFFGASGTRALAKAQALKTGGSGIDVWNFDVLFFNITYAKQAPLDTIPPQIFSISSIPNVDLVEAGTKNAVFNFSVENSVDINDSSASARFFKSGEQDRMNSSCALFSFNSSTRIYECTIGMQYYSSYGMWDVEVKVDDVNGNTGMNASTFNVNVLRAISINTKSIEFPAVNPGNTNVLSLNLTNVTNYGNYESSIVITAYDLRGETNLNEYIDASSFRASSLLDVCNNGIVLSNSTSIEITGVLLQRRESKDVYYCLNLVPGVSVQRYSSIYGWQISLMLAVLIPARKKKLRRKIDEFLDDLREDGYEFAEVKDIIEEKMHGIPISIFSRKIGMLEAVVKYMKENMNMRYSEIARILKRDERTIWASYNKCKNKDKLSENGIRIPFNIFTKDISIFKSVVTYLKEKKGIRYNDIAKLLDRDQRNIWATHRRKVFK